jgi:hypothetical protein
VYDRSLDGFGRNAAALALQWDVTTGSCFAATCFMRTQNLEAVKLPMLRPCYMGKRSDGLRFPITCITWLSFLGLPHVATSKLPKGD